MQCCSECFSSAYLKDIINSSATLGNCDFCSTKGIAIYDPKDLALFFQNIFDLYKIDNVKGTSIEVQMEIDFKGKIFSDKIRNNRKKLLNEIISDDYGKYKRLFTGKVVLKHIADKKKR